MICFATVAICGLLVYLSNGQFPNQPLQSNNGEDTHKDLSNDDIDGETFTQEKKNIMWYATHRQSMISQTRKVDFSKCVFRDCQINNMVTNRYTRPTKAFDADAVLVQSKTIFNLSPPPRRNQDQVFILAVRDTFLRLRTLSLDNSSKSDSETEIGRQWLGLFNWTMTYRLDSDIVYTYSNIIERNNMSDLLDKDYDGIFDKKEKDIAWLVSHCKTKSRREDYVNDLMTVINVDITGGCGENASCPKGDHSCLDDMATKYKFYLAFENTFYADYVSEKLFNWFNRDIVVVVRGGANYSRLVPPGTVIDASDFESATDLGYFLKQLAADKDRYLSYLKRKDNFYAEYKLVPVQEAYCKLCEYLHTLDQHRKTYDNIRDWWMKGIMD